MKYVIIRLMFNYITLVANQSHEYDEHTYEIFINGFVQKFQIPIINR